MTCPVDGCDRALFVRGYCSRHYYRQLRGRPLDAPTPADIYADLMDLIGMGEAPLIAAQRVGVKPATASRWMYRHGRPDIARLLNREATT